MLPTWWSANPVRRLEAASPIADALTCRKNRKINANKTTARILVENDEMVVIAFELCLQRRVGWKHDAFEGLTSVSRGKICSLTIRL